MRIWIARAMVALALMMPSFLAFAEYPVKAITIVVPFPVATASDLIARILAAELSSTMGQPVLVQNRPGGNSAIGVAAVTSAAPDGYTLLLATAGTVALPSLVKSLSFDITRDLAPISMLSRFALFLYVNSELPVRTLPELFEYVRTNPGKLNYGTGNSVGITATLQMLSLAGNLKMVHVPYKGEPAGVMDLVSNRVQMMFSTPSSAEPFVKSGKLRLLATNLPQRASFAPDVPSVNEYLPKFSVTAWAGLMGPRGMPKEAVDRLARDVSAALNLPQTREKFERLQFMGSPSTPTEFAAFFKDQLELYSRALLEAGIKPE